MPKHQAQEYEVLFADLNAELSSSWARGELAAEPHFLGVTDVGAIWTFGPKETTSLRVLPDALDKMEDRAGKKAARAYDLFLWIQAELSKLLQMDRGWVLAYDLGFRPEALRRQRP